VREAPARRVLLLLLLYLITLYISLVVVVVPVEMWKTDLTILSERVIFHRGCGNDCGNYLWFVEKGSVHKVFHISTGMYLGPPVEMWKTLG
jgi:hypothetical protein